VQEVGVRVISRGDRERRALGLLSPRRRVLAYRLQKRQSALELRHDQEVPTGKTTAMRRGSLDGARGTRTPDLLGAIQGAQRLNVPVLQGEL
jgi:hypothetical protein